MTHDPFWEPKAIWYEECVKQACKYPLGSFAYIFWWSLRHELNMDGKIRHWATEPKYALETWLEYFKFKWVQLARHREARE